MPTSDTPTRVTCDYCGGAGTTPADDGRGLRSCVCCKGTGEQPDFTGRKPAEAKLKRMGLKLERVNQHLHATRAKLRKVEQERDALRERVKELRFAVRFYAENSPHSDTAKTDNGMKAKAALAATEVPK